MRRIELTLSIADERLDKTLARVSTEFSRAQWQRLISEGQITLDGEPASASHRLRGGETIVALIPDPAPTELVPQAIPLDIVYEDDDIIVVNKPAGMVVHPGVGHESGTLANAIMAYCPDVLDVGGEMRPGIVHRLDKDTSGLIVVAKSDNALSKLQEQFKARSVDKRYLALVEGIMRPAAAIIDAPLGRDPRRRKRMAVITHASNRAREAQTRYETLRTYAAHTLLECRPRTGRTHQIRVHLAYVGFPIVGDSVYGRRKQDLLTTRHFLHASQLTFQRPSDGESITLEAGLAPELQALLDRLPE